MLGIVDDRGHKFDLGVYAQFWSSSNYLYLSLSLHAHRGDIDAAVSLMTKTGHQHVGLINISVWPHVGRNM